jgi:hypothetical protein
MAALVYRPLDPNINSIRLLRVCPGEVHEPLQCVLLHAELHDRLLYHALSYTWSLDSGKCNIQCDGVDIEIGKNLWNFLRRFRSWNADGSANLWIDAICEY